jgi:heme exporter protein A
VLRVEGVEKRYGDRLVLRDVTFSVARGELLLVTGANGAGKTTLLRLLTGLAVPSAGTVEVDGDRSTLGFVGHEPLLYRELTASENLELFGRLYRVPAREERARALLEQFGLADVRDDRVSSFSRGMTQRLALCRALLHRPSLIVLDEPFTALDREGAEILDATLAGAAPDAAVVVSTHEPERIDRLASQRLELGSR